MNGFSENEEDYYAEECNNLEMYITELNEKIVELEKEIEKNKWLSVKDRLPDEASRNYKKPYYNRVTPYIVFNGSGVLISSFFKDDYGSGFRHYHNKHSISPEVTHWMPLPEPPKNEV